MEPQRPKFTPEAVDEQLDQLLFHRVPASQDKQFIRDLSQMYQSDERSLANVWQRLGLKDEQEGYTPRQSESTEPVFLQQQTSAEHRALERNDLMHQASKRPLVRVFSLLAAACVATLLVGALLAVFTLAHQQTAGHTASPGGAKTGSTAQLPPGIYVNDVSHVYRLNVQTHQAFWSANLKDVAQIIPAGNAVYILQSGGAATGVVKLDANTGAILWNHPLYMKSTDPNAQLNESITNLVLAQDRLYIGWLVWSVPNTINSNQKPQVKTVVNDIYALSTADGKQLADYAHVSAETLAVYKGILAVSSQNTLRLYNTNNGQWLWHVSSTVSPSLDISVLSIVNNLVYVTFFSGQDIPGQFQSFLAAYDLTSGQQVWQSPTFTGGDALNNIAVNQNVIYFSTLDTMNSQNIATGHVYAYDVLSKKQLWKTPIDGAGNSLILNNGVVYEVSYSGSGGHAHLAALDATTGTIKWQKPLLDRFPQGFALANGVIYVSSNNDNAGGSDPGAAQLQAINADNGNPLWQTSQYGTNNMTPTA